MNRIIKILMNRDGITYEEAKEMYLDCKSELMDAIEGTSCLSPDEVLLGELGLEIDYILILFEEGRRTMKTVYTLGEIFANNAVLHYCEDHGIYEVYSRKGNVITYYSYFGSEGFYKVVRNVKTGSETRTRLRYSKTPKFLAGEYGTKYNYFCG